MIFLFSIFIGYSQSKTIYYENFDADNGGWVSSTLLGRGGQWSYNANPIVGEGSYWSLNNYDNYGINYTTSLTSPVISTSGFNTVTFYIDIRYKTEAFWDGMNIEYTTDPFGLIGWTRLGNQGQGLNWYNDNDVDAIGNNVHGWSGTNTEVALSPSKFIQASISSSAVSTLNNATSIRFRINFGSDNINNDDGVAIDNVIIKGEHIVAPPNPASGPGNINSNLKLWLKANTGTNSTLDNSNVTQWQDQAYDNIANSYGTVAPKYRNDASRNINFNPVIDFSRNGNNVLKGKGGYWSQDYYVVVKTNSTFDKTTTNSQEVISGRITDTNFGQDGTGLGFGRISSRFNSDNLISHMIGGYLNTDGTTSIPDSYGRSYAPPTPGDTMGGGVMILNVKSNTSVTPNITEIYLNGKRIDNHTGTRGLTGTGTPLIHSDFNNSVYQLGVGRFTLNGNALNTYLDGRITEVASYSTARTAVEQQKIQSYLGIKNGVTLHSAGSTTVDNLGDVNYIDSNGSIIWDATSTPLFNYDIAGIGRDDNTQLNQKQSKSENAGTVLTIGLGDVLPTNNANTNTFPTNRNFLMWGSNNGSMVDSGVDLPISLGPTTITTITEVVNRKWKVNEVGGDVPTTRVAIPTASFVSGLPALGPTDAYVMVVATNAAFTTGLETVFMSTTGGNQTCLYDFDGTKYITFGVAHRATNPLHITLDGVDDYVRVDATNDLPTAFTVMTWIRPNGANTSGNERTILSKKSAATNGYQIVLQNDNRVRFEFYSGSNRREAITTTAFPDAKWHNIAFTYTGSTLSIYIDGVFEKSVSTMTGPITTSTGIFSIGGQYLSKTSINNLFKGDIDELRMWDRVLTPTEIQFIMNQEILQSGTGTVGTVIPSTITKNDVSGLLWNNLFAYYSMNSYIGTHLDDDSKNVNRGSLVIPDKISINVQTAPLPYETDSPGTLWEQTTKWKNGATQDLPNSNSIINNTTPINWNIVRTNHNINSTGNKTVLGLFVNSNILTASNDSKIEVTHYLRLNGKIDLVGRSQLVQKTGSDLDILSSGTLERDQQGQANLYNYNYWGSPVGTVNTLSNNANYTVAGVLRDGTSPSSPALFQWTSSLDANNATIPKTLSRYWINKFDNLTNAYANWSRITETDPLRAGQGFTLKGTGAAAATQNLVFVGKPNNGTITNTVGKEQLLLVANPYPSALDAVKFINDNLGGSNDVITGNLYFWEHYTTNSTHFLKQYQGGYGVFNLTGGAAPSSDDLPTISGSGSTNKAAPRQFIPVGQGFFVIGNESGASTSLQFNNSQREFVKEDAVDGSSNPLSQTMYRSTSKEKVKDHWTDNSNAVVPIGNNKKIHIGFNLLSNNFHRQVLLGFMDEKANNDINPGYDAANIDGSPSDMYLLNKDKMLSIQGEGYFNKEASYPIAVKMAEEGKVSFVIDKLENFDADQNYFIYDAQTDTYNSIKKGPFEVLVAKGEHKTRFALHFTDKKAATVSEDPNATNNKIEAIFTRYNNTLNITNGVKDATIETVQLYNIQGACIKTWDIKDKTQFYHKLPITENSSEFYIVKIKTSKGIMTQKIIVK